jgi:hypothetical protein
MVAFAVRLMPDGNGLPVQALPVEGNVIHDLVAYGAKGPHCPFSSLEG